MYSLKELTGENKFLRKDKTILETVRDTEVQKDFSRIATHGSKLCMTYVSQRSQNIGDNDDNNNDGSQLLGPSISQTSP